MLNNFLDIITIKIFLLSKEMDEAIKGGLERLLGESDGLVIGSNDFLYTDKLERHPCVELLYLYGWHLKSLGVDTIFIENHYVNEPIQTRGFIGQLTYCCYLFDLRPIGLEFKGTMGQYEEYTGREVRGKVTTVAYDEPNRILRLNRVVRDIVSHQSIGKWVLFCGMSHVNDAKNCEGIKTLLGVPGLGIQLTNRNFFEKKKDFVDGSYRRPTDYLIGIAPPLKYSSRLYVDSMVFTTMHAILYFFKGYRKITGKQRLSELIQRPVTARPIWYDEMAAWITTQDPELEIPDPELLSSIVYDLDMCPRDVVQSVKTDLTESSLNEVVDTIVLFVEKDLSGKKDFRVERDSLLDMLFLERKTLPLEKEKRDFLSAVKRKFQKQLNRPETHLYQLFQIMCLLGLSLPKTRNIKRLFT